MRLSRGTETVQPIFTLLKYVVGEKVELVKKETNHWATVEQFKIKKKLRVVVTESIV